MEPFEMEVVDLYWTGTAGLSSDKVVIEKTDLPVVVVDDSTGGALPSPQNDPSWIGEI